VESRGETLTPEECVNIFQRFYRRDPNRSMNHSYGLGLSIAQTIVSRHKGKIWAVGKDGVNTFYVQLPMN
jgi:signal transduction histidine kinase